MCFSGLISYGCSDFFGYFFKFFRGQTELLVTEVEVAFFLEGNKVDVGVRNLHAEDCNAYARAGDGCLYAGGNLLCESPEAFVGSVVKVEDVVDAKK